MWLVAPGQTPEHVVTYGAMKLAAICAEMTEVHTLCLNMRSVFATIAVGKGEGKGRRSAAVGEGRRGTVANIDVSLLTLTPLPPFDERWMHQSESD